MSIQISHQDGKTIIELSNGHSRALKDIKEKWNIKDEEATLGFAFSVLMSGDAPEVFVENSGKLVGVVPTKEIEKEQASTIANES